MKLMPFFSGQIKGDFADCVPQSKSFTVTDCDVWCSYLEAFRQNGFGEIWDRKAFYERLTGLAFDTMLEFRLDVINWPVDTLIDELRIIFCRPRTFQEILKDIRGHKREPTWGLQKYMRELEKKYKELAI